MATANPVREQGSVLEDLERIKQESLETLEKSKQLTPPSLATDTPPAPTRAIPWAWLLFGIGIGIGAAQLL